jgi:hypothetical protein
MALVFGMTVIGCDNGTTDNGTGPALNGTWLLISFSVDGEPLGGYQYQFEIKFNNGNYEGFMNGTPMLQATYTTSGNQITITTTRVHGNYFALMGIELESRWYSKNELKTALIALGQDEEDESTIDIDKSFSPQTANYSVNGNTLVMTMKGTITYGGNEGTYEETVTQTATYTRKN